MVWLQYRLLLDEFLLLNSLRSISLYEVYTGRELTHVDNLLIGTGSFDDFAAYI